MPRESLATLLGRHAFVAVALLATATCSPPPTHQNPPPGQTAAEAQKKREACTFGPGATAADTLGAKEPRGDQIPIDHIVLIMQENESFDHYYSMLPGVTAADPAATNPDADGTPVARFHETKLCVDDPPHSWNAAHAQWDDGANDGFVKRANPGGTRVMGYYDETNLPYYYAVAKAFAISDAHFCSVLGPTWPNRFFYFAGTTFGVVRNTFTPENDPLGDPYPNVFSELNDAKVTWKDYATDAATPMILPQAYVGHEDHFVGIDQFYADAAAGTLPSVSFVEAAYKGGGAQTDEHPPGDVQLGQAFVAKVLDALFASPQWAHSALFLTYDENGGFYDSVPPPKACVPDDLAPKLDPGDAQATFDHYGFRVPLLVVSPYVRRGYVSHVVTDHTSILRFVELRFGLPAMTKRDANADPMFDMFDFAHPDTSVPKLPDAVVEPTEQSRCASDYP